MTALRIPPGRAGRLWLRERLALAGDALSLLERKQAVLAHELTRLRSRQQETGRAWTAATATARTWRLRAAMLGGERALDLAAPAAPAELTVHYATLAGVRYPTDIDCPVPQGSSITMSSAAVHARAAHATALSAAAAHAAASAAVDAVQSELTATRIRAQALRHRRIPDLRSALATLEFTLAERERAELPRSHTHSTYG
ncbi:MULTISPECIES: V-type ATP synthase subunit D [unclassified Nocardia]|uniref:V-type ATP synthase subunit D n=1 Tax=unclassified Nocardia TaxID=2637762 RepID=UPI001CE463CE|nr:MULTISPECIES: V-type ATP synthase subunit D [unclassified Nocardia]